MRRERRMVGVPEVQAVRPYGLGIDVAKDFHAICLLVPHDGKIVRFEWECINETAALLKAKRRISALLLKHQLVINPFTYTLESTSTYHYPLIRTWGGSACIVNPALAASFKARKTDRIDAYKLATHSLQGLWPISHTPTNETEVLRFLTRTRRRFRASTTRLYNSITTRLWQWNCMDRTSSARGNLTRACIEDLAAGRYQGTNPMFDEYRHVPQDIWDWLARMYLVIDTLKRETDAIEKRIATLVDGELADRLLTFPGVGPVAVATWLAEAEPASRFPSASHCVAYCGLDPTPQISGDKQVGTRLRGGNPQLRAALIQSASVCLNGRSLLGQNAKLGSGRWKLKVCVLARRLCRLLYKSSTEGIVYDESKVIARIDRTTGAQSGAHPRPVGSRNGSEEMAEGS